MYGSYYEADYYRNPVPYTSSDIGEPVPGWGVNPEVAGPSRLGVGQAPKIALTPDVLKHLKTSGPPLEGPSKPLPWWIWPVSAAVVLGAVGWYGTKQGWL